MYLQFLLLFRFKQF